MDSSRGSSEWSRLPSTWPELPDPHQHPSFEPSTNPYWSTYAITPRGTAQQNPWVLRTTPQSHWHSSCVRLLNLKEDNWEMILHWSPPCLSTTRAETWPRGTVPMASRAHCIHPQYCHIAGSVPPQLNDWMPENWWTYQHIWFIHLDIHLVRVTWELFPDLYPAKVHSYILTT